jgi:hypothetical protein
MVAALKMHRAGCGRAGHQRRAGVADWFTPFQAPKPSIYVIQNDGMGARHCQHVSVLFAVL